MGVILRVARGEGLASVGRRVAERVEERLELEARLMRGRFAPPGPIGLLNVLGTPPAARLGGMQIQWRARLRQEQTLRDVALWYPNVLELGSRAWRTNDMPQARALVVEGSAPVEHENVVLVVHDLQLLGKTGHARAVIFPSAYLRDRYGVDGHVIEPGLAGTKRQATGNAIAFAGAVRRDKGAHLLPELIAAVPGRRWHIFGGGDEALLRPLRRLPGVTVHGYYRSGTLPSLLARHGAGVALLPSIVPESYGLTLSECWLAGVPAITFDHGAQAERIRREGGGWLVPLDEGAAGIAAILRRNELTNVPAKIPTPSEAAAAHVALYRKLGLLD